jgi:tripartite-type tricarboxylate transporter receptor subunit TctC
MKRRSFTSYAAASLIPLGPVDLRAQDRVTRILVGFSAGGSTDAIARLIAEKIRSPLGQSVVVDNKPGAGGRLAMSELKRSKPDGQTLVLTASGVLVLQPWFVSNLGFDPRRDFTPVARVTTNDFVITAGPSAPPGDLKTVLAWMRDHPDKAAYAHSGAGTTTHFVGQMLMLATGVKLSDIPYKGGAPAAMDLVGGQVPLMIDTASETIEYHKAGKVRILAVTGEQRARSLPDVPTLKEVGINVTADAFLGLYGPAGMRPDVVDRIAKAVAEALRMHDVQEKIYAFGSIPGYSNGQDLAAIQAEHLMRWESPVKASGFKPD